MPLRKPFSALVLLCVLLMLSFSIAGARAQEPEQTPEEEAAIFLLGNLSFIMFHEIGHALVDLYNLPVLGREEDAVDNFATVLMVTNDGDPVLDQMVMGAAEGWLLSHELAEAQGYEPLWAGEHGLDLQRFYSIMCLLYASAPDSYEELADDIDLPEDRRLGCQVEYEQLLATWDKLLVPHVQPDNVPPRGPVIGVSYEPTAEYADELDILKESELLETLAEEIRAGFILPRPLSFKAMSCGEENAFWDSEQNSVIMCYEMVGYYLSLLEER